MSEAISVLRKCIIEEYLSNWFTYEELAEYLCIDVDNVRYTLEEYVKLDKALLNKINRHREHIEDYINAELLDRKDYISDENKSYEDIAIYIIKNKASLRQTAAYFHLGKTTIFDYIHEKLPTLSIRLYKQVFDVLMENKSFAPDKKEIMEQVMSTYESFMRHGSCREVEEELGLSRNVVQRNLTTRLKQISKEKYEQVKQRLEANQIRVLEENGFKRYG